MRKHFIVVVLLFISVILIPDSLLACASTQSETATCDMCTACDENSDTSCGTSNSNKNTDCDNNCNQACQSSVASVFLPAHRFSLDFLIAKEFKSFFELKLLQLPSGFFSIWEPPKLV